jgi:chromosome segregation ATPase
MGPGAMYESEASRLQREADSFTKKYEHEKKRLMILEDQYKQAVAELDAKKDHLKKVRPATAKVKKDTAKSKVLENQLDKHLKHFNNLQAENRTLRHQIDVMRKEQNN